jgi:DNA-binding MarR family transcriptional regulator
MGTDQKTLEAARQVMEIIPLAMRTVGAEMRRVGHGVIPVHMRILGMCTKRVWTLSELAEAQAVSLPSMSKTVNTLVERGWLTRTQSEEDRRVVRIRLTPAGRQVLDKAQHHTQARVAELLAPLSAGELETLLAGLAILRDIFLAAFEFENREETF